MAVLVIDVAHTLLIDCDGCIAPLTYPDPLPAPFDGVKEAIAKFRASGWRVLIFTGRASVEWPEVERRARIREVEEWLSVHGIEVDGITADKVPSAWLIDDRAVNPYYSASLNRPRNPSLFWHEAFDLLTNRLKADH